MKPTIVVTEGLEKVPFNWLRENAQVIEVTWKEPEKLRVALRDANAMIVRTYTQVTDELLSHGPKLRVVGRAGVGRAVRWFWWTFAGVVCVTTVTSGQHYFIDVPGGAAVAWAGYTLGHRLVPPAGSHPARSA